MLLLFQYIVLIETIHYEAHWASLDSRPLPSWYDESKCGIFIAWGVYSIPGVESECFWNYWKDPTIIRQHVVNFMKENCPPPLSLSYISWFCSRVYDIIL
jgi:hypothetical protein